MDGQNNHDWISTTDSLYATLQASNRFKLQVETAPQDKSTQGIRALESEASDYLKQTYQDFRAILQDVEKDNKENW